MNVTRRKFLGASAVAALAAGTVSSGRIWGANDRIGVAVLGVRGQGNGHLSRYLDRPDQVDVVALCDPDAHVLEERANRVREATGKEPALYADVRELLANDAVDIVSIASPNHWHALSSIWACQAGKDVYVEKPLSHNVFEGRKLVEAAEKYNRVVMHGTQSRCSGTLLRDMQLIHDGFIGEIFHSRGYVYKNGNRHAIGHGRPGTPPDHLNWTQWQGPAQEQEYMVRENGGGLYVHYDWHWFWEYGNGEIGNQGVHEMDIAAWGHDRGLPVRVQSTGGRYAWDDDGETPNTQATSFTFADGSMMTFEIRNLGSFHEVAGENGDSFFGSEGYYVRGAGFFDYQNEPIPVDAPEVPGKDSIQAFLDAVRSRNPEDNYAPPLVGHISCALCHIGNIAYRLGRSLEFDPETEQFKDDTEANQLLTREYRQGFEVPETV